MNQSFLTQFRQLHHEHITLLRRKQGPQPPESLVAEAEDLLYKLRVMGSQTHDAGPRRRLESYAAYWGAFIYDHSLNKPYPNTALEPVQSDTFADHAWPDGVLPTSNHKTSEYINDHSKVPAAVPFLAPPMPPYSLVGRDELLQALKKQLLSGDHLAISALNGLPGVGKTALAIALAHDAEIRAHFKDGILWAGLGPEADMMAWLSKWGHALGIGSNEIAQFTTVQARVDRIRTMIGSRQMLLVVDDAWSVRSAMTFKLGGPACSHIVTTRFPQIALRFAGDGAQIVRELDESNGLILLKQLAPQVVEADSKAAEELVHAVGGLPLALVLMGNYLRLEGYDGRKRRIRRALNKLMEAQARMELKEGQIPAQPHPSLPTASTISIKALIAVSDDVLDDVARQTLYALSLFPPKPNTFSEEAALAVSNESVDALDTLSDYGLLESQGDERYTLHHVIADYAKMKNKERGAGSRLVHFFVGYLSKHEKDHQALELDTNNILAALDLAFAMGMQKALMQATLLFYDFLEVRGLYELAVPLLTRAEQSARETQERPHLVSLLLNLGRTVEKQGNYLQAEAYFQEGLTIAQALDQQEMISKFLQNLGAIAGKQGRYDAEEAYYKEGLRLARYYDLAEQISSLLANLGAVAMDRGEYDLAERYLEEGLFFARTLEDPEIISRLLTNQGVVAERRGAYEQAEAFYQESLVLARSLGYQEKITRLLLNLGDVAITCQRYQQAEHDLQEALTLARSLKLRSLISLILAAWGKLYLKQERWQEANRTFQETLQLAQELGSQQYVADALFGLAQMALAKGELSQAKEQAKESLAIFDKLGHGEAERVREWLAELAR